MIQVHFGHNRAGAFAVAWNLAQAGARVALARHATGWTVTVQE